MTKPERKDIHNSDVPVLCRSCEVRHRGICGALDPEQLAYLATHSTRRARASSQELIAAGQEQARYANLMRGVVKLTKLMADGRQQIVGLQFAPDFLGSPFTDQTDVTAETATDVELCTFPRAVLEEIMHLSPQLEHRVHQQAHRELDEARDWLLTLGRKSAAEKVASFLYLIATHIDPAHHDRRQNVEFELPLRRSEIADFLGLTTETVSRRLTKLRKSGVIGIENARHVTVPDIDRLRLECEQDRST